MQDKFQKESKRIQQKQMNIKGMSCKSCADLIEDKLKVLEGIKEVKVSFAEEQAFVRFDQEQITLDVIEEKIKEIGYEAQVKDKINNNTQKEKMVRIRLEKPSILTILVGITLIFTFVNLYYTVNLKNKLAFVAGETIIESESQDPGVLKEIAPSQLSQQGKLPSQPSQQQPSRTEISADDDPVRGLENAPITMIEFSDFECSFCARFVEQTLPQIEENYIKTGKVKLVFRDFPLPFHENAKKAHQGAECADEQGKFWEYHDLLFENYQSLDTENLKKYAKDLGLDTAKFNGCLDSEKMASEVQKDFTDGSRYGVNGTPTFFINGIEVVGAQPYSVFEEIIEQELNK